MARLTAYTRENVTEFLNQPLLEFKTGLQYHPILFCISINDTQLLDKIMEEKNLDLNRHYAARKKIEGRYMNDAFTPLEVAFRHCLSSCSRSQGQCQHLDCMLNDPNSMLSRLLRYGASISKSYLLVDSVLWPHYNTYSKPVNEVEISSYLQQIEEKMMEEGCSQMHWRLLKMYFQMDHIFIGDYIRACIEHGLQYYPEWKANEKIIQNLLMICCMWYRPKEETITMLRNLWLCGFPFVDANDEYPDTGGERVYNLLPEKSKDRAIEYLNEAKVISQNPLRLTLLSRSAIRQHIPLVNFKNNIRSLLIYIPKIMIEFLLYVG